MDAQRLDKIDPVIQIQIALPAMHTMQAIHLHLHYNLHVLGNFYAHKVDTNPPNFKETFSTSLRSLKV